MKRLIQLLLLSLVSIVTIAQDTTIFYINDGFETLPRQWVSQPSVPYHPSVHWEYQSGGHSNLPAGAREGSYNAYLYWNDWGVFTCNLVSPAINLSTAKKPQLTFYHAQAQSSDGTDKLSVLFKVGASGTWETIQEYITPSTPGTQWFPQRVINIDEYGSKYLTNDFYIAFSGNVIGGHGVCIDAVKIEEKDVIDRYVSSVSASNVAHPVIPSGVKDIPLFRVNIEVVGNNNDLILDSIQIKSISGNNSVFENNSFELIYTRDEVFRNKNKGISTKIGTAESISNGIIKFTDLNLTLKTGSHCLWLVADIKPDAVPYTSVDFILDANSIFINNQSFPATEVSPPGSNTIEQSVFLDDFEEDKGWTLENDFERDVPKGKFVVKSSDPDYAYSGEKVLGTDLNDDGAYPLNVSTEDAYFATTPVINMKYFNKIKLSLMKWNYIEPQDNASLDVSVDGGTTWTQAWMSQVSGQLPENLWNYLYLNSEIADLVKRQPDVRFRLAINYSDGSNAYAGWNIDNFAVTGEYLTNDIGITEIILPCDDCINSGTDQVQVVVKNYAAIPTPANMSIFYSLNGKQGLRVYDTIPTSIPVNGSINFTFTRPAGFPIPDVYNFLVATDVPGDQDRSNDSIYRIIKIQENLSVPSTVKFETADGYWISGGIANTWECRVPESSIGEVPGSPKAWILSPSGNYTENDSSFIISSCYNLTGSDRLIIENKYWVQSEKDNDGANVQYTVNDGVSWNLLTRDIYGYPWGWYDSYVTALKNDGWSGSSTGWQTAKTLLPAELNSQSKVKFRVLFQSDADTSYRGIAYDDFKIYKAPNDIGVTSIDDFATQCEGLNPDQVTVNIKNYGLNSLKANDTIIAGFSFNNVHAATDTFLLAQNLLPGQTIKHTFPVKLNILTPATYRIDAYTQGEDDPYFYGSNNDSMSVTFTVLPNPYTEMPDTIPTRKPDTVVISPFYDPDYDYLWHDGYTQREYHVNDDGWHFVTITDARGNGCSVKDSVYVELLFNDVGADDILLPEEHCGMGQSEFITARIRNFGTDSIAEGQKIAIVYELNGGEPVADTLELETTFYSNHFVEFTFRKGPVDLAEKGIYNFKIYTSYGGDTIPGNDTITRSIEILGRPSVSLGPDITVEALSHTMDAGSGYESYLWDNGETGQSREVTTSGSYWVQVFDANQCSNSDTAYIRLKIRDISPQSFESPLSDCEFSAATPVSIRVYNTGTDTVPLGSTIEVSYLFNGGDRVTGNMELDQQLMPGGFAVYPFAGTVDLSAAGDYSFEATAVIAGDLRSFNDTVAQTVYRYEKPVVDFGLEETEYVEDVSFTIEAGYSPYYAYQWQDTVTTHNYTVTSDGMYHVTATDTRTSCYDRDSVFVFLIYSDVGVTWTSMGNSGCTGDIEDIRVRVTNLGPSSIGSSELYIACDIDGERITMDTLSWIGNFSPGAVKEMTLSGRVAIEHEGINSISLYTIFEADKRPENDSLIVIFDALPGPEIDFGDVNGELNDVDLPHVLDAGAGHQSYLWQDNSTNRTFTANTAGVYSVTVTGQNDCQSTKTVSINITDGTDNFEAGNIVLYPNPNSGKFRIMMDNEAEGDIVVKIVNLGGQPVYNMETTARKLENETIDVQHLSRGVYLLQIYTNSRVYTGRLVIQ